MTSLSMLFESKKLNCTGAIFYLSEGYQIDVRRMSDIFDNSTSDFMQINVDQQIHCPNICRKNATEYIY